MQRSALPVSHGRAVGAPVAPARAVHGMGVARRAHRRGARKQLARPSASLAAPATSSSLLDVFWRWLGDQGVDTSAVRPGAVAEGLGLICDRCARARVQKMLPAPRTPQ